MTDRPMSDERLREIAASLEWSQSRLGMAMLQEDTIADIRAALTELLERRRSPDWIEEAAKVAESMFSVDGFATADVIGMHVRDGQKAAAREIAAAIRALKEK